MTKAHKTRPESVKGRILWCPKYGYVASTLNLWGDTIIRRCRRCRVVKIRLVPMATRRKKQVAP